ncbi:hypothetical protein J2J97_32190 (plasmid) [Rhizobium bangladeshense]|uniref:hypothetical protein n=1 Tax=Rhizobium bangladeshense TaxID=1138189 RepID=UPI001A98D06D|nr:hypothetical protein [Rhizobium bangladeshense]QSY98566.1 hypothetical protein J2J97_32190 [Rhizobium bangladeshense]
MKIYLGRNGAYVSFEKVGMWWHVTLRGSSGEVADKVRCDEYRLAVEYRSAFLKIARAS